MRTELEIAQAILNLEDAIKGIDMQAKYAENGMMRSIDNRTKSDLTERLETLNWVMGD